MAGFAPMRKAGARFGGRARPGILGAPMTRRPALTVSLLITAALGACVSPTASFKARAVLAGLSEREVPGAVFEHAAFFNSAARRMASAKPPVVAGPRLLHIYVDGDGKPYEPGHPERPTRDPTPRNPITLGLIAQDDAPAVLLGRPCFDGLHKTPQCASVYWNDLRYSEPVVASMTAAMNRLIEVTRADGAVLFGISGGGALALLIADRSDKVKGLVTVAANLDLDAWYAYHANAESIDRDAWWAWHKKPGPGDVLNPATDGRRHASDRTDRFERHYAGGRDKIVPPATQIRGLRSLSEQIVIPAFDHNCCWARMWPEILKDAARAVDERAGAGQQARP